MNNTTYFKNPIRYISHKRRGVDK